MIEHVAFALQALLANKLRALLTMLGVIIGVLAITLLVSVGDGARRYIETTLSGIGTNLLSVVPGRTETRGSFGAPNNSVSRPLTMDDVHILQRQGTLLRGVSAVVQGNGAIRYGSRQRDTPVFGVGPEFSDLRGMHVSVGSFVREEDLQSRRRVAVIGQTVVRELFGHENALGQSIRVAGGRFRVIGLMEEKGRSLGFDLDDLVFIPATTAQDLFSLEVLSGITTAARDKQDVQNAIDQIEELLARRRNGEKTFTVQSQEDLLKTFGSVTSAMTAVLLAIASVSLVVGGIGIMNIMLVSVQERTREIGVRRAIGATRRNVLTQFLVESLVIATAGGAVGLALGAAIVLGVRTYAPSLPVQLSPWIAVVAFSSSFVVGVISGVIPARRASRLNPVDALRYE